MPSVIVEVQKRSLGGNSPKSAFALWQIRINNCIFSSILADCPDDANNWKTQKLGGDEGP